MILGDTAQTFWQRVALMKSVGQSQTLLPRYWYEMLEEYYFNNGLYDDVQKFLFEQAIWTPGMKPLRNPANRAVEFYVSKIWPGPLPRALKIVADNKKIIPTVKKVWEWSNWSSQKQLSARWLAIFGDMFIKVAEKAENGQVSRVYLDPIKPVHVTDFILDERGFITYIRMDVPDGDFTHTEVWSKTTGDYRLWRHERSLDTPVEDLGRPDDRKTFEQLGFDFIPLVHAKFKDVGESRGVGCFVHGLDKIDEANRQATRLHQILFRYNKATMAISANSNDASGKPLPPPTLMGADGQTVSTSVKAAVDDDDLYLLPGMSKLEQMVPNINYDSALAILNSQMEEISHDLPEVLYFELRDRDLSGTAIERLLGPAIDRVVEARGNAEPALIRAHQMAMTIGSVHGLFKELGDFSKGDFSHSFADRPVITMSSREKADTITVETQSGIPLITSMLHNGYTEEEVTTMLESPEYKLTQLKLAMDIVQVGTNSGIPVETMLEQVGWTKDRLETMGTQRLAQIKLQQEDVVTDIQQ